MSKKKLFVDQLQRILNEYQSVSAMAQYADFSDIANNIEVSALITKSMATIERIVGKKSEYYNSLDLGYEKKFVSSNAGLKLRYIIGIVRALKDDLENDYLQSLEELIHADVFSDYIEMANYLVKEGYKDAAAVIAGSTLESHLRKLCLKNSLSIEYQTKDGKLRPKKADLLNSELTKVGVYNKINHKQVTAWLGLRNEAAHGNYNEYEIAEVKLMISGINNFIINYAA